MLPERTFILLPHTSDYTFDIFQQLLFIILLPKCLACVVIQLLLDEQSKFRSNLKSSPTITTPRDDNQASINVLSQNGPTNETEVKCNILSKNLFKKNKQQKYNFSCGDKIKRGSVVTLDYHCRLCGVPDKECRVNPTIAGQVLFFSHEMTAQSFCKGKKKGTRKKGMAFNTDKIK